MPRNMQCKLYRFIISPLALTLLFSCPPASSPTPAPLPWLSTAGNRILDANGNVVILRGVSLPDLAVADHIGTRSAVQRIDMATDAANGWNARVIRLPVYPDTISGQPGWNQGPDAYFNDHLNPAVQECLARGVYCIIDWHYIGDYDAPEIDTATRSFWSYVAPRYASVPNVIFELFNEANRPTDWASWKSVAQPWVDLIRSSAPNNLILVTGPNWSKDMSGAVSNPFTGGNIVYVSHIYPKFGDQSYWDTSWGNYVDKVPFLITEWGWQNNLPGEIIEGTLSGYGIPFSNYLEAKGAGWTTWVFCDWWIPVMFDADWNVLGGEDYMGQFTKAILKLHNNNTVPAPVNLLLNGDFSDSFNNWNFWITSPADGSYGIINTELKISITNSGTEKYHIGFIQSGLDIKQGTIYYVSFTARTDPGNTIEIHSEVQKNSDPWTNYAQGYYVYTITETKNTFSYLFKMNSPTDNTAGLTFHIGKSNTGNIYFDDIGLQVVGE